MEKKTQRKFLLLLSVLLCIYSCKKENSIKNDRKLLQTLSDSTISSINNEGIINRFFVVSDTCNPEIKFIVNDIRRQNQTSKFVAAFIKHNGYPIWDKSLLNLNGNAKVSDTTVAFIPVKAANGNEITAYIFCLKQKTGYTYHLYKKSFLSIINPTPSFTARQIETYLSIFSYFENDINNISNVSFRGTIKKKISDTKISFMNQLGAGISMFSVESVQICYRIGGVSNTSSVTIGGYECETQWYIFWGGGSSTGTVNWWFDDGGSFSNIGGGVYSNTVAALMNVAGLNGTQADFLQVNPDRANELLYYLQTTSTELETAKNISKQHIDKMINDNNYLTFVLNHAQTTASGIVWWEDDTWLNNSVNFNLDIDELGNQYDELTQAEKALVKIYPMAAYEIKKNVQVALDESKLRYSPSQLLNGKGDAFRHAFWMAMNERDCGKDPSNLSSIAKKFGDAHESEDPQALHLEKEMDLYNNSIGINVGSSYWFPIFTSNSTVAEDIEQKLNNGELKYLKPLDFNASKAYDANHDKIQDCPTCLDGILLNTILVWTNQ
ncbi:MAG: hypothetical protein JST86_17020 [Bacteroidetes bacterium]|nr:hypothetical protein [Bacteroidota bacterium]